MTRSRARRLFNAGVVVLAAGALALGYVACSGEGGSGSAAPDASVDLTRRAAGQLITPPGLARVVTSGGILAGSGTTSNPLTATLSVSGAISGTGSAGSPLTSSSTVSTTSPVTGTGSAGAPVTTSFTDTAPFQGTGSAGSPFSIATNGVSNSLIRQSAGVSVIGRSANSTGNVADITASADGQVLTRASGALVFADPSAIVPSVVPYMGLFGDGSDGALVFDGTTTILGSVPSSGRYLVAKDVNGTNVTINSGVIVVLSASDNEATNGSSTTAHRLFATGTLTVNGRITNNGSNGTVGSATSRAGGSPNILNTAPSAGGGGQATLGTSGSPVSAHVWATVAPATGGTATNPGANGGGPYAGGGGGGGGTGAGGTGGGITVLAIGSGSSRDFRAFTTNSSVGAAANSIGIDYGGTGGGGGGGDGTHFGGSGGGGGGYEGILAFTIAGSGTIEAKGGNGGAGAAVGNNGGGGGGGGGTVVIAYAVGTPPTCVVTGGTGGAGVGTGRAGGNGIDGKVFLLH
jgi:hypothetical protein